MIRFPELEHLGVKVAAMSDCSDGDCRAHSPLGDEGRRAFCRRCEIDPDDLILPTQVHGTAVARATWADRGRGSRKGLPEFSETDALITDVPGLPLAVTVADCVPVIVFEPRRRAAGIAHAGRTGTLNNIAGAMMAAMEREFDVEASAVRAVIGPSAGPEAYVVSEDMAREFAEAGLPVRGRFLDLWEANAGQLEARGVFRSHIFVSNICTITDGRFHSHRAHANGMRNMAVVAL